MREIDELQSREARRVTWERILQREVRRGTPAAELLPASCSQWSYSTPSPTTAKVALTSIRVCVCSNFGLHPQAVSEWRHAEFGTVLLDDQGGPLGEAEAAGLVWSQGEAVLPARTWAAALLSPLPLLWSLLQGPGGGGGTATVWAPAPVALKGARAYDLAYPAAPMEDRGVKALPWCAPCGL